MSEESQITWFVILALIGAGTAVVYIFKLLFWILFCIMVYPGYCLIALAFGVMFWYAITKK
jgi:hypothetical protein